MRHQRSYEIFVSCIDRGRQLCGINEYLSNTHSGIINYDDILRSAVILGISAFDFFIHELYRNECLYRLTEKRPVDRVLIPFHILSEKSGTESSLISAFIDETNSYRSFVAPDKIADALRSFMSDPWDKISQKRGADPKQLKLKIRRFVDWRNRIAHQADINPNLGGIDLWPIVRSDVIDALDELLALGKAIQEALEES